MKKEKDFYQVSLKVIIKNDRGEILLLAEDPNGSSAGFYDLLGGRITVDEFTVPLLDVLRREITEEIGEINFLLDSKPIAIGRHLVPAIKSETNSDIHVLYVFFEAKFISGEIIISDEHSDFKWVDFSKEEPAKYLKSGNLEGMEMYLQK